MRTIGGEAASVAMALLSVGGTRTLTAGAVTLCIHDCRSNPRAEAEATRRRAVLRAARLPRGDDQGRRPARGRCEGARRSHPRPARRRPAPARRPGLRVRARAAVRRLAADALPPPQEAAR